MAFCLQRIVCSGSDREETVVWEMWRVLSVFFPSRPAQPGHYEDICREQDEETSLDKRFSGNSGTFGISGTAPTRFGPTAEEIAAEFRRPNSGPAKVLATYLEKPNAERLE
jgi:hypothetical protein